MSHSPIASGSSSAPERAQSATRGLGFKRPQSTVPSSKDGPASIEPQAHRSMSRTNATPQRATTIRSPKASAPSRGGLNAEYVHPRGSMGSISPGIEGHDVLPGRASTTASVTTRTTPAPIRSSEEVRGLFRSDPALVAPTYSRFRTRSAARQPQAARSRPFRSQATCIYAGEHTARHSCG